jgi:lysine 2,3-aminomutase
VEENDWREEIRKNIRTTEDLPPNITLQKKERVFFKLIESEEEGQDPKLDFNVTRYYASLAGREAGDPIRRQFLPVSDELKIKDIELPDPLGEEKFTPCERLIHRYKDRALLLVTSECAVYCRHCFRRSFSGSGAGVIGGQVLTRALQYIGERPGIKEILLSGGDPLTLGDKSLLNILERLRAIRENLTIRICSRIPVVLPGRIGPRLASGLSKYHPLWMVTQFNHPRELTDASRDAVDNLLHAGIPVLNQAVLLKGINDSPDILEALFQGLVSMRVKPYYLFQGDLAQGTSHFRTTIKRGLEIMDELKSRVSSLALPIYAVDLPGGGGKVNLMESVPLVEENGYHLFQSDEGKLYRYPAF